MNARLPFFSMDQVELKRGMEAEIRSTLDRLKPDTRRGAEMLLGGLGFSEEDYDGPLCDWANDQYSRMDESEREDAGWRFWEDEAYGARLPRLSRVRRMLCAGLAVALLALGGCEGSRTRLNPGADLAWYEGSAQWMFDHLPPGVDRATAFLGGYYDPSDGSITTNEQLNRMGFFKVGMHELGIHAFNHQKPADMEELMRRYESPAFSFGFHCEAERQSAQAYLDTVPDPIDVKRALQAARDAEAAQ